MGQLGGARRAWLWAVLMLAVPAAARAPGGTETIHSEGVREIETVISRAGWHLMGQDPGGYRLGTGTIAGMTAARGVFIQACGMRPLAGDGAIEYTLPAGDYAGKRVRAAGRFKKVRDRGAAFFYMNALGPNNNILRSINLRADSAPDWNQAALVMDVPESASLIEIGISLRGAPSQTLWLDAVTVEIVDQTVPRAGTPGFRVFQRADQDAPLNCDGIRQ